MGVEVRCGTAATAIDRYGITVRHDDGDERIEARTKVWAAGVQASPLAKLLAAASGAEIDRAGRILVEPDGTLRGHPEVFAIGDMVSLNGLPGIAQPALQEGKYVGKVIRARLDGDADVAPFKYFDKGSMATIGRTHAVARSGGMSFTGIIAYLMWAFIHVLYLIGWGNRFGTLYSWGRSLWFTKNRAHRIITLDQAIDEIGARFVDRRHHFTEKGARQLRRHRECSRVEAARARRDAACCDGRASGDGCASFRHDAEFAGQPATRDRQRRRHSGKIGLGVSTSTSIAAMILPSENTGMATQWLPSSSSPDETATCAWRTVVRQWRNFSGATTVCRVNCGQTLREQAVGDACA